MIKYPVYIYCPYMYISGCKYDIAVNVCSFRYKIEIIRELEIK